MLRAPRLFWLVDDETDHLCDLHLVEKCLAGEEAAIRSLQETHAYDLRTFLVGLGASAAEAHEIVAQLWADGLMGSGKRPPLFRKYSGRGPLRVWLKTVCFHLFYDRKRKAANWISVDPPPDNRGAGPPPEEESTDFELLETGLLQLMRAALELAFARCTDEEFVMLNLKYRCDLSMEEICRMWNRHNSTISRLLSNIREKIAIRTHENLRAIDPFLEIKWSDFVEMCQWARPSSFD